MFKYMYQCAIILAVTALGIIAAETLPLPVPSSIYGLAFMFLLLLFKIVKISHIKEASDFFLGIMPVLFIPVLINVRDFLGGISGILLPIIIFIPVSTAFVMFSTGKTAQLVLKIMERKNGNNTIK